MQFDVFLVESAAGLVGPNTVDVVLGAGGLRGAPARVAFAFSIAGQLDAGEARIPTVVVGDGPLEAASCRAKCGIAPTGTVVFKVYQEGVQVGTVTWSPGQRVGTVALTTPGYVDGDYFELEPPAIPDLTFSGAAMTFSG